MQGIIVIIFGYGRVKNNNQWSIRGVFLDVHLMSTEPVPLYLTLNKYYY